MSKKIKKLLNKNILYCDVGARWGLGEPWSYIKNYLDVIYFEPDREEYENLKGKMKDGDFGFDCALYSSSQKIDLNLTKARECSSVLEPNFDIIKNYPNELLKMYEIEKKVIVDAKSLDQISVENDNFSMDFMKLDVQGAELEILKGGEKFLSKNIIGMEIEVEFQKLYIDQPLFSDIDSYVTNKLKLELFDLSKHYCKYKTGINKFSKKGQLVFGDALYLRSPFKILEWCSTLNKTVAIDKIISACIIGYLYGYIDYSLAIISQNGIEDYLNDDEIKNLKKFLLSKSGNFSMEFKGSGRIYNFFNYLGLIFKRTHNGWASFDGTGKLGSKKKFGVYQ